MPYAAIPARLITVVAEQTHDSARWGRCPKAPADADGEIEWGHRAQRTGPRRKPGVLKPPRRVRTGWKGACELCGEPIPWKGDLGVYGGSGNNRLYDTASGKPEPGDLFWVSQHSPADTDADAWGTCYAGWTNCNGRHLIGVLPNGHHWDIDSRANNCGSPADTLHRCWIRHGAPPALTVDKAGVTCTAGAGSILSGDYHGFMQAGVFTAG